MKRILITSMGGSGSNSLLEALKHSSLGNELYFVGTHADKYELACSNANINYLVPWVRDEEAYIKETLRIEAAEKIDLVIPNSDREVLSIGKHRDRFRSKLLIPDPASISKVQDKYYLFKLLKAHGVPVADTYEVNSLEAIDAHVKSLPDHGKFWLRVKTGAGSVAATWVKTADQARAWIKLWQELQGLQITEFVISEFLPGDDYAVQTIWKKGKLLNAKICQRLSYYDGDQRLSGMASTPGVAKTLNRRDAVDTCIQAIEIASKEFNAEPNGVYELDMKGNAKGLACVTEINIGRFPMINAIFSHTGNFNAAELYVRAALDYGFQAPSNPYDFEPNILMIRGLDKKVRFCKAEDVDAIQIGQPIDAADLVHTKVPAGK